MIPATILLVLVLGALFHRHLTHRPKLPTGWEWRPRGDGAVLIDQTDHDRVRGWVDRSGGDGWRTSRGYVASLFGAPITQAMGHVERELQLLGWKDEVKP